jgi:hypothetical protein
MIRRRSGLYPAGSTRASKARKRWRSQARWARRFHARVGGAVLQRLDALRQLGDDECDLGGQGRHTGLGHPFMGGALRDGGGD